MLDPRGRLLLLAVEVATIPAPDHPALPRCIRGSSRGGALVTWPGKVTMCSSRRYPHGWRGTFLFHRQGALPGGRDGLRASPREVPLGDSATRRLATIASAIGWRSAPCGSDELVDRNAALFSRALTQADGAAGSFLLAKNEHEGELLERGVADLGAEFFIGADSFRPGRARLSESRRLGRSTLPS